MSHPTRLVAVLLAALLYLGLLQTSPSLAQQPANRAEIEAIHKELRAIKTRMVDAVNQKKVDALVAELTPDVAFTAINNDTVVGADKVKAYYDRMLNGASRFLNNFSITAEADTLSRLYADNRVAIATGKADARLDLRGGSAMKYTVPLRWTATLERGSGTWKLAAIHFSADLSDNPYLDALSTFWKWATALAGILALVLGYVLARFLGRKRA